MQFVANVKDFLSKAQTSWKSLSVHQRTSVLATVFVMLLVPAAMLLAQSPIKLRNQAAIPATLPGADSGYTLEGVPESLNVEMEVSKPGESYNVYVLLRKDGQIVTDQSEFGYSWGLENSDIIQYSTFAACVEGIQPPCPEQYASLIALKEGKTYIKVSVFRKSTNEIVGGLAFHITVAPKTPSSIPNDPSLYKTLSFGQTLQAELKTTDLTDPISHQGNMNLYKVVLPDNPVGGNYKNVEVFTRSCNEDYTSCYSAKGFTERSYIFDSSFQPIKPQYSYDTRLDFDAITINPDKTYYILVGSDQPVTQNKKYLISFWYEGSSYLPPQPIEPKYYIVPNPTYTNVQYDLRTGLNPVGRFGMWLQKDGVYQRELSDFKYVWALSDSNYAQLRTEPYCVSSDQQICQLDALVTPIKEGSFELRGQIQRVSTQEVVGGVTYKIQILGSLKPTVTPTPTTQPIPTSPAGKTPDGKTPQPAQPAPINPPKQPAPAPDGKTPNGNRCTTDADCKSGYCANRLGYKICQDRPKKPNNSACKANSECQSNYCAGFFLAGRKCATAPKPWRPNFSFLFPKPSEPAPIPAVGFRKCSGIITTLQTRGENQPCLGVSGSGSDKGKVCLVANCRGGLVCDKRTYLCKKK